MTTSTSSPVVQNPPKAFSFSGCLLTALVVLFVILGIYRLVWGFILAYVFSSANMLSLFNICIVLLIICQCAIYFFLAIRLRQQNWLLSLALVVVVWLILPVLLYFGINISTVRVRSDGYSMGATLPDKSYLLADKLAYKQQEPQRGDIIVFIFPVDQENDLIKRVIGLPGETITVQDGVVSVDGTPLEEPYIVEPPAYNGEWVVPESQYFVLGDNRNDSRDSHQWGFLPQENIIAKVVWIYLPLERFGKVNDGNFQP